MFELVDSHRRKFVYLRLSVTDRCHFRCVYCLPSGYRPCRPVESELNVDEIRRLVAGFAHLGIWKVRLTGGEPTVRRDIVEIAKAVASVPGITQVGITTNGNRLKELAVPLRQAGITSVNISVDSLDKSHFEKITGTKKFSQVIHGVDHALAAGFKSVKINVVLLKSACDLPSFKSWVSERSLSVRFIELMRTGENQELFGREYLSADAIQVDLLRSGWSPSKKEIGAGPAVVYQHKDYRGTLGLIAPYSTHFCEACNRLRVSSQGALRLCLFGEKDEPLRDHLRDDSQLESLANRISALVVGKPISHFLREGKYGNTSNLAQIGG